MRLNRSLIKLQARQLIKGKVWKLFVTLFVVGLCLSAVSSFCGSILGSYAASNDIYNEYRENNNGSSSYGDRENNYNPDYFNGFGNSSGGNDFFDFTGRITPAAVPAKSTYTAFSDFLGMISTISSILLGPLGVTTAIFFVWFVRGSEYELARGIEIIFKESFNGSYLRKLVCVFLKSLITTCLMALFIIPGIVFYYSSYFAFELMCDYPELSGWEAIKLSKKMCRGHRGELFAMDLSFLGWFILCIFIFPIIYVRPYKATTNALYYENFRLRALQTGELTEDDFLSEQQRFAKYANGAGMSGNPFGEQNQTAGGYVQPQGGYYQPPVQQAPQYAPPQAPSGQTPASQPQAPPQPFVPVFTPTAEPKPPVFTPTMEPKQQVYAPPQTAQPVQPQQPTYTAPVEQAPPTFTVSEPVAPQEPTYAEVVLPEEPVDVFTQAAEPTEPTEPTDITNE